MKVNKPAFNTREIENFKLYVKRVERERKKTFN